MSKQLEVLSNPNLVETPTLLADEEVKEGLKKLKQMGRFGIESIDKTKVTETPNQSASAASALQPTVSSPNDTTAPEPLSIKVENEQQGDYMSEEDLVIGGGRGDHSTVNVNSRQKLPLIRRSNYPDG